MKAHFLRPGKLLPILLVAALGACDNSTSTDYDPAAHASVNGSVQSGTTPLAAYEINLYRAGSGLQELVASTSADDDGGFNLSFTIQPGDTQSVYYLVAEDPVNGTAGHYDVSLAAALGTAPQAGMVVVINERTTVAIAYAMAQFLHDDVQVAGAYPGLQNAAATTQNLADRQTGQVGAVLANEPNGLDTSTLRTFNSLANMLAACVQAQAACETLFANALTLGGGAPANTLEAMRNVARNPWQNVGALFALAQTAADYAPHLAASAQPVAWTLAVRYIGDGPLGQQLDGPGNVAFDAEGNAWIANNYEFSLDPAAQGICGGRQVMKLTPTGGTPPGAPYGNGGLYGAGFGVAVDAQGNAWVGNFGFQGASCQNDFLALSHSVSKFAPDGEALSDRDTGIVLEGLSMPQGMNVDQQDNLWVVGCTSNSVIKLPGGDPQLSQNFDDLGLQKPFDIAFDSRGHGWITSNATGTVVEVDNDGKQVGEAVSGPGIVRPMGIASDSQGNIWVSGSGVLDPPCPTPNPDDILIRAVGENGELNDSAAVTLIRPDGEARTVSTFGRTLVGPERHGLRLPWGIAIDGNDNVFIANFAGQRLMALCGVREEFCPPGTATGDALGSDDGFPSDALTRNTAVQIDSSGNVWLTNNWIIDAFSNIGRDDSHQNNPGAHAMVVYIGLAAPVKTPMAGPPRRP